MTIAIDADQRRRLLRDGFCLFEQVLDGELLDRTRTIADGLLDRQPPEHFEQQKSTGSMISVYDDPAFAELVSCPAAIDALARLGFPRPKWWSGFVISKPAHGHALREMEDPRSPVYQAVEEAVDVPVRAGDLVIGDSRLLHSAHANDSARRRTVITLWYFPAFDQLPESIRSYIAAERMIDTWPAETRRRISHLLPEYDGGARPIEWNRVPGPALRAGRRGLRR